MQIYQLKKKVFKHMDSVNRRIEWKQLLITVLPVESTGKKKFNI